MKVVAILMLLSTSVIFGQSAARGPEPVDLVVLHQSWSNIIVPPLYEDPFAANNEVQEFVRDQRATAVRNAVRTQEGQSREYSARTQSARTLSQQPPSTRYSYRVSMKNTGSKTIARIEWDYFFLNPDTLQEAGHRSFTHEVKIRPGKEVDLSGQSSFPPIRVIDATQPVQDVDARYSEKIVIRRIEYADGSVWTRLSK